MTRICASLEGPSLRGAAGADMVEMRMDRMDAFNPEGVDGLATFCGKVDLSRLPDGFSGMIDIGEEGRPDCDLTAVSSFHDYGSTPSAGEIAAKLSSLPGDIAKGAFMVNGLRDLRSIYAASKAVPERHVLLGMGELGKITRIRGDVLGNEFTFAYVSAPTAPGQLKLETMLALGDGCMVTGILGNPLHRSMSPAMHEAAYKAAGIRGTYLKFETGDPSGFADMMRDYNVRGINVTVPFKEKVSEPLDWVDPLADGLGAINTVVNDDGVLKGYNTDVAGVDAALDSIGFQPRGSEAVIMGYGGGARACACALSRRGCVVRITGRNAASGKKMASSMGLEWIDAGNVSAGRYGLIANCTPVGMHAPDGFPISLSGVTAENALFDMAYGADALLARVAETTGSKIARGEEMLAGQGAESFRLWTGSDQLKAMRGALGL